MIESGQNARRLRLLVTIASYGTGHLQFLKQIIRTYQSMAMEVHVVVFSEAPKGLGIGVEEIVGLPSRNTWTLPFAHKPVFAQRVEQYDLFIYTEDDIGISERQIRAFLEATPELEPEEIAGFLRYEVDPSGTWLLAEPWGHYHWKPESVRRRGRFTVAEFTNEHAGFYILTRSQLRRAIASGGFLRGPCRGRYGWPETAATDPYTQCGFRKVICISALDDFLVHHLPDRYVAQLDVSLGSFREQIQTLMEIAQGRHPASTFSRVESDRLPSLWQKFYYEKPKKEILEIVPRDARSVLSVGCGSGEMETRLQQRGARITVVPLDSVIGTAAARRGFEVVYGTWDECFCKLGGRRFDCVIMKDLLHLQPDPGRCVAECSRLVGDGGSLVLGGPNFNRLPWLVKRWLRWREYGKLRSYERGGFSVCGPGSLTKHVQEAGLRIDRVVWLNHAIGQSPLRGQQYDWGSLTAREWALRARRSGRGSIS